MKKSFLIIFSLLLSTLVFAQAPPPAAAPASGVPSKISPGSLLPVELAKTVDAKKAKSGDPVMAKIPHDLSANGKVVIPQDAKVIGHVAEVKSSDHDSKDSMLGIVFDKISMKDGAEIPLSAEIQAVAAPVQMAPSASENATPPPQSNPTGANQNSEMGSPTNNAPSSPQPQQAGGMPESPSSALLTAQSQGVVGMKGYSLSQGTMQDSVITSQDHNVKLESGTQIILKTK
jgi:hypothetical protein